MRTIEREDKTRATKRGVFGQKSMVLMLATLGVGLGVMHGSASSARGQSTWSGAAGGALDWGTAGNWSAGGVPTSTSTVTFTGVGTTTSATAATANLSSSVQLSGLTFTNTYASPASPTFHRVNVGANTLTVSNTSTATINFVGQQTSNGTDITNVVFTGTGAGSVVVNVGGDLTFQRGSSVTVSTLNTTVDFSGVPSLQITAPNVFLARTTGSTANFLGNSRSRFLLGDTSTITASGSLIVGAGTAYTASSGGSATNSLTGGLGVLVLGRNTNLKVANFIVGAAKSNGSVVANPAFATSNFTLGGVTPGSRTTLWGIGEWNATTDQSATSSSGTVNLTGGVTVNALVNSLNVGRSPNQSAVAANTINGALTFDRGTIDATNVVIGAKRQFNTPSATTGTIVVGTAGGTSASPTARLLVGANVTLGATENAGLITLSNAIGNLTIHAGGTVAVTGNILDGGANNGAVLSQSNVTLNPNGLLQVNGTLGSATSSIDNLTVDGGALSLQTKSAGSFAAYVSNLATGANTTSILIGGGAVSVGTTYTLIKYGTLNNFNFFLPGGAVTGLGPRSTATLLNNQANSSIDLAITGDAPQWTGSLDGMWTTATQASPKNWSLITAATATDYIETDAVLFNDLATTKNVNLVSTVNPSSVTVNNSAGDYVISGAGSIAGATGITKQGTATLTLGTSNTYSGPTTVQGGTLIGSTRSISGSLANSATAQFDQAFDGTFAGPVTSSGTLIKSGAGTVTLSGSQVIGGTISVSEGTLIVSGNMSGAQSLTVNGGTGKLVLSGVNTFGLAGGSTPALLIDGGATVSLGSSTGLPGPTATTGSLWLKSGTLELNGNNVVANNGNSTVVSRWNIGGDSATTSAVVDTGTGTLTFQGGFYAQNLTGVASAAAGTTNNGSASLTAKILGRVDLGTAGTAAGALTSARSVTVFDATPDIDLEIAATISGTGIGFNKAGSGTLYLSGANTFDGGLHLGTGVVLIDSDAALGAVPSSPANNISFSAGSLRLNGSFNINANRNIALTNNRVTGGFSGSIDTQGFTSTYGGSIANAVNIGDGSTGNGGFEKRGTGSLTVTGNLTYSGPTTVAAGELIVGKSLITSSSLVVGSGSGTNTVTGVARLNAPHSSAAGTYNYAGSFTSGITVNSGSMVTVSAANLATETPNVLKASVLSIAVDANDATKYAGFVDLVNNDLILTDADLAVTRAMVAQWYAGGARNGLGLGASAATLNTLTTLAVFKNDAGNGSTPYYPSYDGVSGLTASTIIVKYTYLGDTDLNGVVDGSDVANVMKGIRGLGTGWGFGDTNYDGVVNGLDYSNVLTALRFQGGALASGLGGGGIGGGGSAGVVPEPSAILLLVPALSLVTRRRRRA